MAQLSDQALATRSENDDKTPVIFQPVLYQAAPLEAQRLGGQCGVVGAHRRYRALYPRKDTAAGNEGP